MTPEEQRELATLEQSARNTQVLSVQAAQLSAHAAQVMQAAQVALDNRSVEIAQAVEARADAEAVANGGRKNGQK